MLSTTPFALSPGGSAPALSGATASSSSRPLVSAAGSWRYRSAARSRPRLFSAMAISAAVHVAIFFGFGHKPVVVPKVKETNLIQLTITMPELKELEDDEPVANDGERPEDPGMPV